jgi:hypothetical protein
MHQDSAEESNASRSWQSYVETVSEKLDRPSAPQGTTDIGTILYVPPDLDGMWDRKTDMFGVGVILFEMLCPFNTGMERLVTLHELRKPKTLFPAGFESSHFEAAIMIRRLLQASGEHRPCAEEVLVQVCALRQHGFKRSDSSPALHALSDAAALAEADGASDQSLSPQASTERK